MNVEVGFRESAMSEGESESFLERNVGPIVILNAYLHQKTLPVNFVLNQYFLH